MQGTANFWVYGPKFDGRQQRFGHLEIIPDRRWYQVGDTARLLVNTAHAPARLLMSDCRDHYWILDVPAHTQLVEIPITEKQVPNSFIEATVVADGETYTESCQLFVPPIHDVVQLDLRPDRLATSPARVDACRFKPPIWRENRSAARWR